MFATVEFSVEAAAKASPVLLALVDPMQSTGWPALGLGYALLPPALELCAFGGSMHRCWGSRAAMGLAGIVVAALHILFLEPLFLGGVSPRGMDDVGGRAHINHRFIADRRNQRTSISMQKSFRLVLFAASYAR